MGSLEKGLFMAQGSHYGLPIIDKNIKVHPGQAGIKEFVPDGLVLTDGTECRADIVVLPTSNSNMRDTAREILGEEVADSLLDVWDFDDEGEPNAVSSSPCIFSSVYRQSNVCGRFGDTVDIQDCGTREAI